MSIDLTGPQDTLTAFFQTFTLRPVRSPTTPSPCSITPRSGNIEQAGGRDQERGDYAIELPARTTLTLEAGELVTIDEHPGRVYRIVWAPGPEPINLTRQYGAIEKR